jgi:hypothetical protein
MNRSGAAVFAAPVAFERDRQKRVPALRPVALDY